MKICDEIVLRLVDLFLVFIGLFYLFKIFRRQLKNDFWSIVLILLFFTSPILVFYANNFTADAPALGIALIGAWFLWNYYNYFKIKDIYVANLFYLVAGLIKISSLFSLLAVIPIHFYLMFFKKDNKVKMLSFIPFVLTFSILPLWYIYAIQYNKENIGGVFLQGILPIWDLNSEQIASILKSFFPNLLNLYFNIYALGILFVLYVYSIFNFSKTNKFLFFYSIFIIIGVIGYFILFFQVFDVHDYYMVNILVLIPAIVLSSFDLFIKNNFKFINSKLFKSIFIFGLVFLILNTAMINCTALCPSICKAWRSVVTCMALPLAVTAWIV